LKWTSPTLLWRSISGLRKKTRKRRKEFNWETAKYGKIRYVETEFPTIVFDDAFTSEVTYSCEPTVSPLNDNKIDFRISFDKSDDEDYTPMFSYFDDLDFFKDFENEFPSIVYNDALTSKSDFLTEPTVSPQHIDEFKLKNETSFSECDEEEQNILYSTNLIPFNIIYPDTDNDNDEIKIEQPSEDMSVILLPNVINVDDSAYAHGSNKLLETSHDNSNKFFKAETLSRN
ncbi:hypothetical protein Tco_0371794, partial [Tanacetum coccineum]